MKHFRKIKSIINRERKYIQKINIIQIKKQKKYRKKGKWYYMKLKKITAFVIALAMAGPCGYGTFSEIYRTENTVSAICVLPQFIECEISKDVFILQKGDKITKEDLEEHGLKVFRIERIIHDWPDDPLVGTTTTEKRDVDLSECSFVFPEVLNEGKNIIEISNTPVFSMIDTGPLVCELSIEVRFNDESDISVEYGPENMNAIIIDGDMYNYNTINSISYKKGIEEITVPSKIDGERLFVLGRDSICDPGLKKINISDGIMVIDSMAIQNSEALECLTVPDSVTFIGNIDIGQASIRGNIGSYAEKYASEHGYKFDGIGDVTGDNTLNAADIVGMMSYLYGADNLDEDMKRRADSNLDSNINIIDFIMLKQNIIDPKMSSLGASFNGALAAPDLKNIQKPSSDINTDGFNRFAAESAGEILLNTEDKKGTENTVYSPLSVYMALSMATECAASDTQKEMLAALHADSVDELRKENSALFESLYFDDYNTYLKIANSVWMNQKYSFIQDTLQTLADKYYTVSFEKDFSDEKVPKEISQWIYKNTSGKISPEIKMHKNDKGEVDEVMKLINTVTFKEKWTKEFGTASEDDFYLRDGSRITCDFLHRKTEYPTENIGFADNYMKYALEMGDGYRMNFILPDEGTDVNEIVSDKDTMLEIINDDIEYSKRKIVFSVPKFDIESKFDLIEASRKMGINLAFDTYLADFSGVVDFEKSNISSAYIGEITHEAKIVIDEKGCEAAAYTIISMYPSAAAPSLEEPVYFELNRPFFYYVSDSEGTPVFSGIINNPVLN